MDESAGQEKRFALWIDQAFYLTRILAMLQFNLRVADEYCSKPSSDRLQILHPPERPSEELGRDAEPVNMILLLL